ncbi:MAG: hypothetical protein QF681_00775, partial [Vicinamibacterales bacterium]|nr:hypothetical protein [Vicinamibacterales bacterium]
VAYGSGARAGALGADLQGAPVVDPQQAPAPGSDLGQLDGGHISYAALGTRSTLVTVSAAAIVILLTLQSPSWIAWAVLMVVMLVTFGPRHPRTLDHHIPLDRTRVLVAVGALVMFVLCFTPAPIELTDFVAE